MQQVLVDVVFLFFRRLEIKHVLETEFTNL